MKKLLALAVAACLATLFLWAKDFWEKPYTEWKKGEASKMLTNSPWAEEMVFTRQIRGTGTGVAGEKELYDTYSVRFFSALPIRQAYVRLLQLTTAQNRTEEQKQGLDAHLERLLAWDTQQVIVISLDFSSNDREMLMRVQRTLQYQTAPMLKQLVYLISDRAGRVELIEYLPPSRDGTGAKLIFPRFLDGKPVVLPEDKEITFEFSVPETSHKIFLNWKVKKMFYNGELTI